MVDVSCKTAAGGKKMTPEGKKKWPAPPGKKNDVKIVFPCFLPPKYYIILLLYTTTTTTTGPPMGFQLLEIRQPAFIFLLRVAVFDKSRCGFQRTPCASRMIPAVTTLRSLICCRIIGILIILGSG